MSITLYKEYFQKSRIFMYPLLGIKRGVSVTPIETYVSWKGYYEPEDKRLITVYHLRDDAEFVNFEKERLISHRLFEDFKQTEEGKGIYIFNFSDYEDDWMNILNGKYSQLSKYYKKQIESFYGKRDANYAYIESFLYPAKYYSLYAELFKVNEQLLKEVGELCSKLDLEKETLTAVVKNLEIKNKIF